MTHRSLFGHLDGAPIQSFVLGQADGLQAEVLEYGGILRRLSFPARGGRTELVLGLPTLEAYRRDTASLGIIVGRFANRIAGAQFELDDHHHRLTANEGRNHLHGGAFGFGRRAWRLLDSSATELRLGYRSPAGEEGYPGALDVTATYRIHADAMELLLEARADAATPVNLSTHSYFNLAGDPNIAAAQQWLSVTADRYLPVADAELIPTGEIAPVAETPFDFRQRRQIGEPADHPQLAIAGGYDHCLVMTGGQPCRAELHSPHSGITLRLDSPMPALQLYAGHLLDQVHPQLGRGICLEPQGFPNAPNQAGFPSTILRPGDVYRHDIRYQLKND